MLRVVCWNIAHRHKPWHHLSGMDVDVALLQEAGRPPPEVAGRVDVGPGVWRTGERKAAVVKLSDRVGVGWIETRPIADVGAGELAVSEAGTLAVAKVTPVSGEPVVVVSMCAAWARPHPSTGSSWIVSDISAHRVVSDLSALIGRQHGHRILAAGDLSILHGHGEGGSRYWAGRYQTVFARMEAIGLPFMGPQAPDGRQADPWPDELPRDSLNVPTFHSNRQEPATATRQLDFVFASRSLAPALNVRALNHPDDWGPSDHCRLQIDIT